MYVAKIMVPALNITSPYGLDFTSKILLNIINPNNKVKVTLHLDFKANVFA